MKREFKTIFMSFIIAVTTIPFVIGQTNYIDSLKSELPVVNDSNKVRIYIELSRCYLSLSMISSMEYAEKAFEISDKSDWTWGLADAENRMGNVYYLIADYRKAMDIYLSSLKKREKINDKEGIAGSFNNIALIYLKYKNYNQAIKYIEKSLLINRETEELINIAINLNNLAVIYIEMNDVENALEYANQTLDIYQKIGNREGIADIYINLGDLYKSEKDYKKSRNYQQLAIEIYEITNNLAGIAVSTFNLAELLFLEKKYDDSFIYLQESLSLAELLQNRDLITDIHKYLSNYYVIKNNYKKALLHYEIFTQYENSIFQQTSSDQILEKQVILDTDYQLKEIQLLRKDQELQRIEIKKQKYVGIFLIIFSGLLFSGLILTNILLQARKNTANITREKNLQLYLSNQELERAEHKLNELNQSKDKFFSVITNDLISHFKSFLELTKKLKTKTYNLNKKEIKEFSGQIYRSAKNLFNLIDNLLHLSRAQTDKINFSLEYLLIKEKVQTVLELQEPLIKAKDIQIKTNIRKKLKVFADPDILLIILRNLIGNAIKFTPEKGTIKISTNHIKDKIKIIISDTGVGIKPENINKLFHIDHNFSTKGTAGEEGTGIGLILCKELVKVHGGDIGVESKPHSGSTFWFTLSAIPLSFETHT